MVRWLGSVLAAGCITAVLFVMLAQSIEPAERLVLSWIRLLPLDLEPATAECDPAASTGFQPVPFVGTVGFYAPDGFRPVADARIFRVVEENGREWEDFAGATGDSGDFDLEVKFADPDADGCVPEGAVPTTVTYTVRAARCETRRIPVTSSWQPHRVALDCSRE